MCAHSSISCAPKKTPQVSASKLFTVFRKFPKSGFVNEPRIIMSVKVIFASVVKFNRTPSSIIPVHNVARETL